MQREDEGADVAGEREGGREARPHAQLRLRVRAMYTGCHKRRSVTERTRLSGPLSNRDFHKLNDKTYGTRERERERGIVIDSVCQVFRAYLEHKIKQGSAAYRVN